MEPKLGAWPLGLELDMELRVITPGAGLVGFDTGNVDDLGGPIDCFCEFPLLKGGTAGRSPNLGNSN